jgi:hypothetical protein
MKRIEFFIFLIIGVFVFGCKSSGNSSIVQRTYTPEEGKESINPTVTPNSEISPIIITNVEVIGKNEVITLKNISNESQNIRNFILIDKQTESLKRFDDDIILETDQTIKVINGDKDSSLVKNNQYWQSLFVINQDFDELLLVNQAGRILWSYINYPNK